MSSLSLLVVSQDSEALAGLAAQLATKFSAVHSADSLEMANLAILEQRPDAVLADLETLGPEGIFALTHSYAVPVICMHRVPDEEMWMTAIEFGALDICCLSDCNSILKALEQHLKVRRTAA
jgi:DNA-binding NtrC family response regulator